VQGELAVRATTHGECGVVEGGSDLHNVVRGKTMGCQE
jgi:hypothetical protein